MSQLHHLVSGRQYNGSITQSQKVDFLWKKLGYGRTKTDTNLIKKATNESISSPLLMRGDKIWQSAHNIPLSIPSESDSVVTVYPTGSPVECTADITDLLQIELGKLILLIGFLQKLGHHIL